MQSRSVLAVIAAVAIAELSGCASAPPSPPSWLPGPRETLSDPRGGWIDLEYVDSEGYRRGLAGELLALDADRLHVMAGSTVRSVPLDSVATARLDWFDPKAGSVAGLSVGGTITTISNGVLLVFTAPAWIIVGTAATANRSRDGSITEANAEWEEFRPYARFPQGLPPVFGDRGGIPPPVSPAGEPAAPPVPVVLAKAPRATAFWFDIAGGPGFHTEHTGAAFVFGMNLAHRAFMIGSRFSVVQRESTREYVGGFESSGETFDLALLFGLRGKYRSLHASLSAGPASYSSSIGELLDSAGSLAVQAELFILTGHYVGLGTVLTGNWNDVRDFYVLSFGIAVGIP